MEGSFARNKIQLRKISQSLEFRYLSALCPSDTDLKCSSKSNFIQSANQSQYLSEVGDLVTRPIVTDHMSSVFLIFFKEILLLH